VAPPWWEERVPPLSRRELFGAPWKGEGPLPLMGVAPQLQPLEGMLLRRSTDIYPKELARDRREFFNSLLEHLPMLRPGGGEFFSAIDCPVQSR